MQVIIKKHEQLQFLIHFQMYLNSKKQYISDSNCFYLFTYVFYIFFSGFTAYLNKPLHRKSSVARSFLTKTLYL